jgi:exosortase
VVLLSSSRSAGCFPAIPFSTFYVLPYNSVRAVPTTSAIASVAPVEQSPSASRSWLPVISLGLSFGALWFICCWHLSAEWAYNEQYSYGWFVPFFALYLFWMRWEDAPSPRLRRHKQAETIGSRQVAAVDLNRHHSGLISALIAIAIALGSLLLLLPIRLIEVANPDWRPISWLHTFVAVGLTLLLIWRIGGRPWLRHFAFPIMFVLVSVPWISAIEVPIVQGLMPTLASIATEALSLFGIPAEVQGNLVRINGGIVGVNEACSGVRSLQTSIMIGLLFGELKRLGVFQRILLIVGAVGIAFVANCGRAFFLVWIAATRGLTAVEKWHDIAGYTIVGLVFFGCLGITAWLARVRSTQVGAMGDKGRTTEDGGQRTEDGGRMSDVGSQRVATGDRSRFTDHYSPITVYHRLLTSHLSPFLLFAVLVWLLLVEAGTEAWYRSHERNLSRSAQWAVRWPKSAPDLRDLPIDERTRALLHFDKGRGVTWRTPNDEHSDLSASAIGRPVSLLYFFRWEPGHNSALLANAHRPDVCLPATGWRQTQDLGVRDYRVSDNLVVPFRHFVFVHDSAGRIQYAHAFYCVWEDRLRRERQSDTKNGLAGDPSAWTRNERLDAVLQGRRHLGQQVLEYLLVEPRQLNVADAEQSFTQLVPELIQPTAKASAE